MIFGFRYTQKRETSMSHRHNSSDLKMVTSMKYSTRFLWILSRIKIFYSSIMSRQKYHKRSSKNSCKEMCCTTSMPELWMFASCQLPYIVANGVQNDKIGSLYFSTSCNFPFRCWEVCREWHER